MRVAVQVVAETFLAVLSSRGGTVKNYPAEGTANWALSYSPGVSTFKFGTRYVDAKIAYCFKSNIEIFAEARNLGKTHTGHRRVDVALCRWQPDDLCGQRRRLEIDGGN